MQFLPRYQAIEAVPVAVLDEAGAVTSGREYIVTFDNGMRGVLDTLTFEAFFRRADDGGAGSVPDPGIRGKRVGNVENGKPREVSANRKPAKTAKPLHDPAPAAIREHVRAAKNEPLHKSGPRAPGESTRDKILACLKKAPCTSGDLLKWIPAGTGSVCTELTNMRNDGLIKTIQLDGQNKNALKEPAA